MPSFMFLDLVFIVPPLIDKEKRKQKKNSCTNACQPFLLWIQSWITKEGRNNTMGMASVRFSVMYYLFKKMCTYCFFLSYIAGE